jgi:hypothetical protein
MKMYNFFQEITSIDKDMMEIQKNKDIIKICDFANKHIAHSSKENAEEI